MTGKPKMSTSRRQVLPGIDLRQTRFRIDCTCLEFQSLNNCTQTNNRVSKQTVDTLFLIIVEVQKKDNCVLT